MLADNRHYTFYVWRKVFMQSPAVKCVTKEKGGDNFRVGLFLISLGSPHALRADMGRTCGEPNEIDLTASHGWCYRSF